MFILVLFFVLLESNKLFLGIVQKLSYFCLFHSCKDAVHPAPWSPLTFGSVIVGPRGGSSGPHGGKGNKEVKGRASVIEFGDKKKKHKICAGRSFHQYLLLIFYNMKKPTGTNDSLSQHSGGLHVNAWCITFKGVKCKQCAELSCR